MAAPAMQIARLNDNGYEVSLQNDQGLVKCYVRAGLPGPELPGKDGAKESERKQLALKKAKALAKALDAAIVET